MVEAASLTQLKASLLMLQIVLPMIVSLIIPLIVSLLIGTATFADDLLKLGRVDN